MDSTGSFRFLRYNMPKSGILNFDEEPYGVWLVYTLFLGFLRVVISIVDVL